MSSNAEALVREALAALTPNRHVGSCISCGHRVPAERGYLVTALDGSRKPICQVDLVDVARRYGIEVPPALAERLPAQPQQEAAQPAAPVQPTFRRGAQESLDIPVTPEVPSGHIRVQARSGQVYSGIGPGTYTVQREDGSHRTFRVRIQSTDADFAAGRAILEFLRGPQNESDYEAFGFINGANLQTWKRYSDGSHEALVAEAREFLRHPERADLARNCIRCNALLTTPESIALGIGPTCLQKGW